MSSPIRTHYKGYKIEGWDGSDIFFAENTLHISVTKKFADLLEKNKITNVRLQSTEEYKIEVAIINPEYNLVDASRV